MMIDLTGWKPHDDGPSPVEDADGVTPNVRILMRGSDKSGPLESGPSPATAFVWEHNLQYPAGDVIGYRLDSDPEPFTRYRHVRADMGL